MAKHTLPIEIHDKFRQCNVLHGYVESNLNEAAKYALELGQLLIEAKQAIPHGRWETECDRLFDGSATTARFYMRFARDISALPKQRATAVLFLEGTLEGAAKAAKKAAQPHTSRKGAAAVTDEPADTGEDDTDELGTTPQETSPRTPRKGTDKPGSLGKCPVCAGTKWDEDDPDCWTCSKCHHPYGEPAGDTDEDRLTTQRQKTVKTAEALMRAFDDLQHMHPRSEHAEAIEGCKRLLTTAKGWK